MFKFITLGIASQCGAIPFKMNPIAPAVGAAMVTGGSGLASSLISAYSQNKSNKEYLKGVRETNQTNLRIAQETNDLNRQLYENNVRDNRINAAIQNAYDSPSAKLARLRQAGINAYDSQNGVQIQSASPNAAVGATMQAPEQMPAPFVGMNLGGIASSAVAAYQSGQQIESDQLDLYRKGIDNQFYLEQKVTELRLQQAQLEAAGLDNSIRRQQFDKNAIELVQFEDQLSSVREMNSETAKNLRFTRRKMRQEMSDNHEMAMASIRSMDADTAVKWFQANTERYISRSVYMRNMQEAGKMFSDMMINEAKDARDKEKFWVDYVQNLKLNEWSVEDREAYKQMLMFQLKQHANEINAMAEREKSAFLHGCRLIFGTDASQIFKGAGITYSIPNR